MRVLLIVVLLSICGTNGHGQHGTGQTPPPGQTPPTGQQPHVSRQMQDHVHDMEHIRHDLEGQVNKPKEQMTPEEQNFYYFKLHDTNNDDRLDGLEVVAAFDHAHHEDNANNTTTGEANNGTAHSPRLADEELIRLVDDILKEEDINNDGFISYDEFKRAIEGHTNS